MSFLSKFLTTLVGLFLCLSFVACTKSTNWQYTNISTGYKEHDSSRLIYPSTYYTHDMELELVYAQHQLSAYINVYSKLIPEYNDDKSLAMLTIKTPNGSYQILCDRYGGGQKLKIPSSSIPLIINLLEENDKITLSLSNFYQLKIATSGFKKDFNRLKKKNLPLHSNKPIGIAF